MIHRLGVDRTTSKPQPGELSSWEPAVSARDERINSETGACREIGSLVSLGEACLEGIGNQEDTESSLSEAC